MLRGRGEAKNSTASALSIGVLEERTDFPNTIVRGGDKVLEGKRSARVFYFVGISCRDSESDCVKESFESLCISVYGLYGARKVWHELRREQARGEHRELGSVPRCQIERLMRANNIRGVRRDKGPVTTRSQRAAARPADLMKRNFTASRPNELRVVDFTYVATWSRMAFSAFVSDVYSRRIGGWRTAAAMRTQLPLDASEMALWTRQQADEIVAGLIHHSDPGSQAGLNPLHQPTRRRQRARLDRHCRRLHVNRPMSGCFGVLAVVFLGKCLR